MMMPYPKDELLPVLAAYAEELIVFLCTVRAFSPTEHVSLNKVCGKLSGYPAYLPRTCQYMKLVTVKEEEYPTMLPRGCKNVKSVRLTAKGRQFLTACDAAGLPL